MKAFRAAIMTAGLFALGVSPAFADTTLTVGKASANADPIIPVNIGFQEGIFKKHGLDIKIVDFSGGAKMAQAMAAGAIDIGDGAGTEMAFIAKGDPMIGICESASTFPFLGVGLPADSPVKTAKDLKGKIMGVSSTGSLTDWLAKQLSIKEGWGPDGMTRVAIGNAAPGIVAAFKAHQVDGDVGEAALFYSMEENKAGRLLMSVADFQGSAVSGALFASNKLVSSNPAAIRAFLAAWLETLDYLRSHRDEVVKIKAKLTGYSEAVEAKDYDLTLPMYTKTCKFDAEGIATLKQAFVDLKLVDGTPDMSKLYTEAYIPKP
ncbi:MAG TPA: ABC transporter substrate-binding protein [Stellaceae bacterium]|nr:ABC transporter substrate-binding protein [Stellaceae bacterium]